MRDLLSKEHCYDKVHTLLMKGIAYPFYRQLLQYGLSHLSHTPRPLFLEEILSHPDKMFEKSEPPL